MTLGEFFNSKEFNELDNDTRVEVIYFDSNNDRKSVAAGDKHYVESTCSAYADSEVENIDVEQA